MLLLLWYFQKDSAWNGKSEIRKLQFLMVYQLILPRDMKKSKIHIWYRVQLRKPRILMQFCLYLDIHLGNVQANQWIYLKLLVMSPSRKFPARAEPSWGTLISELKPSWIFLIFLIIRFLGPRKKRTNRN